MERSTTARHVVDRRYELVRLAGSGGMATVYEAIDRNLSRRVALKILHPHLRATPLRARFRAEGRATAQIRHPGIVTVYDTIETAEVDAIVMELVVGKTLRDVLDEAGALPTTRALSITRSLADALVAAHEVGIVHRDIKPSNILVTPQWVVKLTDFGIAKQHDPAIDLTTTGSVLGTARYIAPEQLHGDAATERSDVYSLATVCFEMMCGSTPFSSGSDAAIALARLHEPPPSPRNYGAVLSDELERALLRALATDPAQRHPSMRSFARSLEQLPRDSNSATARSAIGPARRTLAHVGDDATAIMPHPARPERTPPPIGLGRIVMFAILSAATLIAILLIVDSQTVQQAIEKILR